MVCSSSGACPSSISRVGRHRPTSTGGSRWAGPCQWHVSSRYVLVLIIVDDGVRGMVGPRSPTSGSLSGLESLGGSGRCGNRQALPPRSQGLAVPAPFEASSSVRVARRHGGAGPMSGDLQKARRRRRDLGGRSLRPVARLPPHPPRAATRTTAPGKRRMTSDLSL